MAIVTTNNQNYTAIAGAIRNKGVSGNFKPSEMAKAIESIPTGGGDKWQRPTEWLPKPNDYTNPNFDGLYFLIDNTSKNAWFVTTLNTIGTATIRYRVEWGITDENGDFVADGYEDVTTTKNSYATVVPSTYNYVWYRVTSPQRRLNGFARPSSLVLFGIEDTAWSQKMPCIEILGSLPYAKQISDISYPPAISAVRHIDIRNCTSLTTLVRTFGSSSNRSYGKLECIDGLDTWNTSAVTSMANMFQNCYSLKEINGLDTWNTSAVTSMASMFYNCYSLKELDISSWDMSAVTTITDMFRQLSYSSGITSLKLNQTTSLDSIATATNVFPDESLHKIESFWKIPLSFSLSTCSLTHESLITVINTLPIVDNQTCTLGKYHLAQLTTEEIGIATEKGWTLA